MAETYAPCEVELEFAGKLRLFRLPLARIAELQEKCGGLPDGAPGAIGAIYGRLANRGWTIQDITEPIRLGLIGGGMSAVEARSLYEMHCERMPKEQLWTLSLAIVSACIHGYEPRAADTDDKKKDDLTAGRPDGSTTETP